MGLSLVQSAVESACQELGSHSTSRRARTDPKPSWILPCKESTITITSIVLKQNDQIWCYQQILQYCSVDVMWTRDTVTNLSKTHQVTSLCTNSKCTEFTYGVSKTTNACVNVGEKKKKRTFSKMCREEDRREGGNPFLSVLFSFSSVLFSASFFLQLLSVLLL